MENGFHTLGPSKGRCSSCPARNNDVCSTLLGADISALSEKSWYSIVEAGTPIINQGEACDRIGVVVSGIAKVVYFTSEGDEHILQLLRTGELIGDPLGATNLVSWEAATDLTLCWLPSKSLEQVIKKRPELFRGYMKAVSEQRKLSQLWVANMRGRSTVQRVAYWLVRQIQRRAPEVRSLVKIELTRLDLASYLNMSSETLCRALHQLDDRKAISMLTPERIEVINPAKLRFLAKCTEERVTETINPSAERVHQLVENPNRGLVQTVSLKMS